MSCTIASQCKSLRQQRWLSTRAATISQDAGKKSNVVMDYWKRSFCRVRRIKPALSAERQSVVANED